MADLSNGDGRELARLAQSVTDCQRNQEQMRADDKRRFETLEASMATVKTDVVNLQNCATNGSRYLSFWGTIIVAVIAGVFALTGAIAAPVVVHLLTAAPK